jgi:Carboxypeptidase regulatory-like domain
MNSICQRLFAVALFLLCVVPAVPVRGQTETSILRGQVTDPSGALVPGATVSLTKADATALTAQTDAGGDYELKGVPAGTYTLSVTAPGFAAFEQAGFAVADGKMLRQNVALSIEVAKQDVTVSEESNSVDTSADNNASKLVIKGAALDALSDDPDELQSELSALAGPSAGPNGGQIYIDGFSGGQLPPKSSIREIRVNQNPFSAQYDKLGYGRVEILTKPGTDKLHGSFMANGNDSAFNSLNPFVTSEPPYYSTFMMGNLGGSLGKKASFFVSVFDRNQQDNSIVNAETSLDASGNPVALTGAYRNPRTRLDISPRIDWQLTPNNTLTLRYMFGRVSETGDGVGQLALASQAYNSSSTEHDVQLSDTQVLGNNTVNETLFQFSHSNSSQTAQSSDPTLIVQGAFMGGGNSLGQLSDRQNRYELQDNFSFVHGTHSLKFGTRLRATQDSNQSTSGFNGTFIFSTLADYAALTPSQYSVTTGSATSSVTAFDGAVYADDEWHVRPKLTLSYGLRYEAQTHMSDFANLAPRLSVAWATNSGKTVVRAGYGWFYDRFDSNYILQAERQNGVTQQQYIVNQPGSGLTPPSLNGATVSPTIYQTDPHLRAPLTMEAAVGVDQQVTKNATVSVTYINSRGVHALLSDNINAPLPATGLRPNGTDENIYQYQSGGVFRQNEVVTNFNVRVHNLSLFGFYMLNFANGDTAGANSFPSNSYNPGADYGRSAFDVRNRLLIAGNIPLKYGIALSPMMVANSGAPFNITSGIDYNGDSIFNDRPAFATDLSRASVVKTALGNFDTQPIAGQTIVPINYGTGPSQFSANVRLSKRFAIGPKTQGGFTSGGGPGGPPPGGGPGGGPRGGGPGGGLGPGGLSGRNGPPQLDAPVTRRYSLGFAVMANNIFNNVNLAQPVGVVTSSSFDKSTALAGGFFSSQSANRSVSVQVNFSF